MTINDFDIKVDSIKPFHYLCTIKRKDGDTGFGMMVQSQVPPPLPWVFNQFTIQPKSFFIDVGGEIIIDTPPVVVPEVTPTTASGSISSSINP